MCTSCRSDEEPEILQVGWLEQITISPSELLLHAKLDTGADNCSIHAEKIEEFNLNGENWVRFEVTNRYGERRKLERRVIRTAKVKKKTGGTQKRPVVQFGLCLGNYYEITECNLVDRSHFQYPVLVGRNFLAGTALVNSSETYTSTPECEPTEEDE